MKITMAKILIIFFIYSVASTVHAERLLYENDNFKLSGSLDASLGVFNNLNTNFGLGRVDFYTRENTGDAEWYEGAIKPGIRVDYNNKAWGSLYGGISAVANFTAGDGDAGGYTRRNEDATIELLYGGWNSGALFSDSLGQNALSISYGRQNLQIGDGLLIYDGNFDTSSKASYWLAPRTAFSRAGLIQLDTKQFHSDLFYLKTESSWEGSSLIGLNLEHKAFLAGKLNAMYIHILDSKKAALGLVRDEMNVYSLNFNGISPFGTKEIKFFGNYIYEEGSGKEGKINAYAWYLEGLYHFSSLPWNPALSYRYAQFSGDDNTNDQISKGFDPLFYGFSRSWGTWYQGEIVGTYMLFNSNMRSQMIKLAAAPMDTLGVGAIYYHFDLDKKNYYGTPVTDRNFADEVNIYTDLSITEHATLSFVYGLALPGKAGRQVFANNKVSHLFEALLFVYF